MSAKGQTHKWSFQISASGLISLSWTATAAQIGMGPKHQGEGHFRSAQVDSRNCKCLFLQEYSKNSSPSQILPPLHNHHPFSASTLTFSSLKPYSYYFILHSYFTHHDVLHIPTVINHSSSLIINLYLENMSFDDGGFAVPSLSLRAKTIEGIVGRMSKRNEKSVEELSGNLHSFCIFI